jgi:hypothetical protein
VNVTPFEPEWEGYVTLEFSNTTPLPAKIYANEGCAQVLFFESDEICVLTNFILDKKIFIFVTLFPASFIHSNAFENRSQAIILSNSINRLKKFQ